MPHIDNERLIELAVIGLTLAEAGEAQHLAQCAHCQQALQHEQQFAAEVASVPQPLPSADFVQRTVARYEMARDEATRRFEAPKAIGLARALGFSLIALLLCALSASALAMVFSVGDLVSSWAVGIVVGLKLLATLMTTATYVSQLALLGPTAIVLLLMLLLAAELALVRAFQAVR